MSLRGLTVINTRPIQQALGLAQKIFEQDGQSILLPALIIIPSINAEAGTRLSSQLDRYDIVIFTSRNAVIYGKSLFPGLHRQKIMAIGLGTARELAQYQITADFPENSYNSEQILTHPIFQTIAGKSVLIITGQGGRNYLGPRLEAKGFTVAVLRVYERQMPNYPVTKLKALTTLSNCIIVTTSREGLSNIKALIENNNGAKWFSEVPIMVISDGMKQFALQNGIAENLLIVADSATDESILDCLIKWYAKQKTN